MFTTNQIITLSIFGATYLSLVVASRWKLFVVAPACVALLLWPGLMTCGEALRAVNWNVVMLYFGMLLLTETLIMSGAPAVLAERLVREGTPAGRAMVLVCVASGLLSTVVENVAVVLIAAPIALAVAKRLNMKPAPMLIGVALSSNLQGAATMVGDPPSMLLAGSLNMNFNDFFWYHGRPSIFFAVEIGAVASTFVLWLIFRKHKGIAPAQHGQKLHSAVPGILLGALLLALAASSVLLPDWRYSAGWLSLGVGAAAAAWWIRRHSAAEFLRQAWRLDWGTGFFIIGVFILVGALVENGLIERMVEMLAGLSGRSVPLAYWLLVCGSVAASAFIDNVPFVAAMLPVCAGLAQRLGVPPELLCFGMMISASIGGNITPIGASANIVAVGIARREGDHVSFWRFAAIGLPFTIAGAGAACGLLWLVWR
jgi:Na+/H+ antiporter NhaD/arsenite permease-like protein